MPIPYEWWGPKQCAEIFEQMKQLGPENCRLELRHYGTATAAGAGNGQLRVVAADGTRAKQADGSDCGDINESHICQPWC